MADSEHKTIVGVCEEISEKNGWTSFHINVGSQYPVRLTTKLEALIADGRAVGQQQATWRYKEQESDKSNPNTGRPYINRYLEKVEAGDTGGAPATPAPERPAAGVHEPVAIGDKDRLISRQVCLKVAATIYQGKGADKAGEPTGEFPVWQDPVVTLVVRAAATLETWLYRDLGEDDIPF